MHSKAQIHKCLVLAGLLATIFLTVNAAVVAQKLGPAANLPIAPGPFKPTWESLQVESKGDVPNIGFWDNPQDTASWDKVKFVKPGTYDVDILVATPHRGADLAVAIGDQEVHGTVPQTGDFANFQTVILGKIIVKQAGQFMVKARPHDAKTW